MRPGVLVLWAAVLAAGAPPEMRGQALSAFARQKAETLLATRLPCLGCHRLDGRGGAIGPDLSAVGARLDRNAIEAMITDPQRARPRSLMPRVLMPESTRRLLVSYFSERRVASAPRASADPAMTPGRRPGVSPRGTPQAYATHCAACHGDSGGGDGWNATALPVRPAALADAQRMAALSDDRLFDTIFSGGYVMNRSHLMPPFGGTLSRDEIHGLVRHIRTLCRCQGPAWSR